MRKEYKMEWETVVKEEGSPAEGIAIVNTTERLKVNNGYLYKDSVAVISTESGKHEITIAESMAFVPDRGK